MNITERAVIVLQEIDATLALAEKATPGPWDGGIMCQDMVYISPQIDDGGYNAVAKCYQDCRGKDDSYANATFIAASRTLLPKSLRCLKTAIEGFLKQVTYRPHLCDVPEYSGGYDMSSASTADYSKEILTTLCDQWKEQQ